MLETESFITRESELNSLKPYIAYYYFHTITKPNQLKRIIYYPNPVSAITIYKNSKVYFGEGYSVAKPDIQTSYDFCYSGVQKHFRVSEMQSPFSKIGIAFKPLGVNTFLKNPLGHLISQNHDFHFNHLIQSMSPVLDKIFTIDDMNEKVRLLDAYFNENQYAFVEERLSAAIKLIDESEQLLAVQDLVEKLDINHKTLQRKFKKHLNCNIKTYIDVVQFRKALNFHLNSEKSESLTALSNTFNYYDQPEFINKFKKISGINPKSLFREIKQYGSQDLFWNSQH